MTGFLADYYGSNDGSHYGDKFWTVYLTDGRQIDFHADDVSVSISGALIAERKDGELTLLINAREWTGAHASSVLSGDPVAVERVRGNETAT